MVTRGKASELLAYVAGIVDGEGCINLYVSRTTYAPRVSVYNSSLDLLELLTTEFGGTIAVMRVGGTPEHPKKTYHWHLGYQKAKPFLEAILPYLRVKKQQALIVLDYLASGTTHADAVLPGVKEHRRELYRQIKELNGNIRSRPQRLNETTPGEGEAIVCSAPKDAEDGGTETTVHA